MKVTRRAISIAVTIVLLTIVPVHLVHGCSWVQGYFHQVTILKGRVVGRKLFGPLQYIRWLRQRPVSAAQLKVYKYVYPLRDKHELVEVATASSDSSGHFDFGSSVPEGHYYLEISSADLRDWFDVEIAKKVKSTKGVLIDISPNYPDCKGGHEFVIYN